jgi:ADP-ribose pyrophosphatase YjhB (NUDIX family)
MAEYCPDCGSRTENKTVEDRERDHCPECDKILWRNPKAASATAIVKDSQILLVKRGVEPDKEKWSLPAGFIEVNDSFREGAARELEEETDLKISPEKLKVLDTLKITQKGDKHVVVTVFKLPDTKTEGAVHAGEDAEEARYWSREEINQNIEKIRKPYRDIIKNF